MSIYNCPKGHESTEPDYCSECGAKITGIAELALIPNPSAGMQPALGFETCPACTAPREPNSGDFCEICGYNFLTGARCEVPLSTTTPNAATTNQATPNKAGVGSSVHTDYALSGADDPTAVAVEVVITIDPSLGDEGSPDPPINQSPITYRLHKESNLIGRSNERRGIYPEIALDFDDAVSHRHALLNRQSDGNFVLRDIGSTNGTKLNGVELEPILDAPLKEGDELTLGHWTRLVIKVVRQSSEKVNINDPDTSNFK